MKASKRIVGLRGGCSIRKDVLNMEERSISHTECSSFLRNSNKVLSRSNGLRDQPT